MILLNADLGEGLPTDAELYPYLNQASIACGGHAGDQHSMEHAVSACVEHRVSIGAHPSYPDPENFGRATVEISARDLSQDLLKQIRSLSAICKDYDAELAYVKPHGALYNDIIERPQLFELVLDLISKNTLKTSLMLSAGLPSQSLAKAERAGVTIIREAFADRQYLSNLQLMPRSQEGAVFNSVEQICCQVKGLKTGIVEDQNGNLLSLQAQSICIHGDNPASIDAIVPITQILNS